MGNGEKASRKARGVCGRRPGWGTEAGDRRGVRARAAVDAKTPAVRAKETPSGAATGLRPAVSHATRPVSYMPPSRGDVLLSPEPARRAGEEGPFRPHRHPHGPQGLHTSGRHSAAVATHDSSREGPRRSGESRVSRQTTKSDCSKELQ